MATPTPHIKSAARKLPIKRKTPQPLPASDPDPIPIPDPTTPLPAPKPEPYVSAADSSNNDNNNGSYDDEYDDDEETEEEEEEEDFGGGGVVAVGGSGGDDLKPLPFKFHRIWSESDEIRFLQGLLGCWSQGMVFPRDLNLFYDRFSESMLQPYTRSQLSEKLRRLRKKFRIMSARIARGQDPARLAPHDRDLLHLCTRLWHPSHAASSPFSAPDGAAPVGNKRRRPNPRAPSGRSPQPPALAVAVAVASSSALPPPTPPLALPAPIPAALPAPADPPPPPPPTADEKVTRTDAGNLAPDSHPGGVDEEKKLLPLPPPPPPPPPASGAGKGGTGHPLAKIVLDVFDGSLNELRMALVSNGTLQLDTTSGSGSTGSDFSKRWQEQRIAELDLVARRLRLVLEDSIQG